MQLSYEQATMVGAFFARNIEYRLTWEERRVDPRISDADVNRAQNEAMTMFNELTDDERLFVDRFSETLWVIEDGFRAMVREGATLLGCVA